MLARQRLQTAGPVLGQPDQSQAGVVGVGPTGIGRPSEGTGTLVATVVGAAVGVEEAGGAVRVVVGPVLPCAPAGPPSPM